MERDDTIISARERALLLEGREAYRRQDWQGAINAFSQACGKEIPYVIDPRRPGDIDECWCDPSKAKRELGWEAQYGIEEMCAHSWNWQSHNPDGHKTAE